MNRIPASPLLALAAFILTMAGDRLHWSFYLLAGLYALLTVLAFRIEVIQANTGE